jgi:hypothetical protein
VEYPLGIKVAFCFSEADGTVPVLTDTKPNIPTQVVTFLIVVKSVIGGPIRENNYIGILFNVTRFPKV